MGNRKIKEDSEHYRVYRLLDEDNNILYIGKSRQMKQRIANHLRGKSNIPKECREKIKKVEFLEFINECDMNIFEIYAISYFNPPYNIEHNRSPVGLIKIKIPTKWNELDIETFEEIVRMEPYFEQNNNAGFKFNKDIMLNEELSQYLCDHYNKTLNNNDKEKLLSLCKMDKWDTKQVNEYIAYNDSKARIVEEDNYDKLIQLKKGQNGYGSFSNYMGRYMCYKFIIRGKRKIVYGIDKQEIVNKVSNILLMNNIIIP